MCGMNLHAIEADVLRVGGRGAEGCDDVVEIGLRRGISVARHIRSKPSKPARGPDPPGLDFIVRFGVVQSLDNWLFHLADMPELAQDGHSLFVDRVDDAPPAVERSASIQSRYIPLVRTGRIHPCALRYN
jgi:hypothetical protein